MPHTFVITTSGNKINMDEILNNAPIITYKK